MRWCKRTSSGSVHCILSLSPCMRPVKSPWGCAFFFWIKKHLTLLRILPFHVHRAYKMRCSLHGMMMRPSVCNKKQHKKGMFFNFLHQRSVVGQPPKPKKITSASRARHTAM